VRNAVSLGGDADTMACIAGGVAEASYGTVPEAIAWEVRGRLPEAMLDVLGRFDGRFGVPAK
jgi:ADP-ribosylglycohydrolase